MVLTFTNLTENQAKLCKEDLTKKDLCNFLKRMQNDKSPGNDSLTNEFYKKFWKELKEIFADSVSVAKGGGMYGDCDFWLGSNFIVHVAADKNFYLRLTVDKMHAFAFLNDKYLRSYG